jgi:hypothetical protein
VIEPQSAFQQSHNWLALYDRPPVACSSARVQFSSFCSVLFPSLCTILLLVFSYLIEFDYPAISHMSDTSLVLVNPRVSGSVTKSVLPWTVGLQCLIGCDAQTASPVCWSYPVRHNDQESKPLYHSCILLQQPDVYNTNLPRVNGRLLHPVRSLAFRPKVRIQ